MNRTVKVTAEMDFELDGVEFRVYDNLLWSNGGEHDDMVIASIDALEDIDDYTTEVEIVITELQYQQARNHQEQIAS